MTSDLRVLTCQQVIDARTWAHIKDRPDLRDSVIHQAMRTQLADKLARESLATFVVSEPTDPDPLHQTAAVIRGSLAVAVKEEASRLALDLAEAEERGFRAAIQAIKDNLEGYAPEMGPTAYARHALNGLVDYVSRKRDHAPAADWRPMRSCSHWEGVEYLFVDGAVGMHRRRRAPRPAVFVADFPSSVDVAEIVADELHAIAWRHAGRPPYSERRA